MDMDTAATNGAAAAGESVSVGNIGNIDIGEKMNMNMNMNVNMERAERLLWRGVDYVLPRGSCSAAGSLWNVPSLLLNERACMRAAISRVLGLGIMVGASLIKLPQIYNVLAAGSVAGLSITSFHIDVFGYTYNLAAHYRAGYPISTYGDFVVLMVQNYVLLFMCYYYNYNAGKRGSLFLYRGFRGLAAIAGFMGLLALFCSDIIPLEYIHNLTLLNVPVVLVGRLPQIYANYSNQSTGTLSSISSWGVFLGATARIFTTLQDVDSWNILYGYVASATLNGIIAVQVLLYRGRKVQAAPTQAKKQS